MPLKRTENAQNPKVKAGRKGGLKTMELHALEFCPTCNRPLLNDYYPRIGQKGGLARFKAIGRAGMAEMGKKGGRPAISGLETKGNGNAKDR